MFILICYGEFLPELPEIETIRRSLQQQVEGCRISAIDIFEKRLRRPVPAGLLHRYIENFVVRLLERRAKYLLFTFDSGAVLIIHLGMSGRLGLFDPRHPLEKHTHVVFKLSCDLEMRFRDPRRFGLIAVQQPGRTSNVLLDHLGVEPLSDEFNAEYLCDRLGKSMRPVKNVLMDATVVVGLGNIYVSEALFAAKIDPCRAAGTLTRSEVDLLVAAIKSTLLQAIAAGGTTLNDFRNGRGEAGFFQQQLMVYQRQEQPCYLCGHSVRKCVLAGRSTFFCPSCQA
ncbi:bifunctional DNA-formamidopyrimidine glycosylase/DNA-(apurinic or apyrimidinic site) lyase [candidate division KSB1 bacterium]|nr:bifunctional DNA-formamidopyrimidine glycosylase/DNA-(apurinic or apyrimidinic site) lyase [candidate division KSB1 bacterium]